MTYEGNDTYTFNLADKQVSLTIQDLEEIALQIDRYSNKQDYFDKFYDNLGLKTLLATLEDLEERVEVLESSVEE